MDHDEAKRMEALHRYRILDTDPEACFDDLSLLASYVCETPIALLSLIDTDRQWFKARHGIDLTETPREVAFCDHAIQQSQLFVVPDTTKDERFKHNPFVAQKPNIRFYAGAPLIARDGYALGTLCVIDMRPRRLNAKQLEALEALRNQAVAQLELRRNLMELKVALHQRDTAEARQHALYEELEESFESVKKLSAMVPLCSACKFDMTIKADVRAISTVTEGVMQMLAAHNRGEGREFAIETALREALANAIEHGCNNDPTKSVQCCVTCDESGEVLIVVRDPGPGFDASEVPDPTSDAGQMQTGGRGVFLINELMDDVRHAKGGREIQMRKKAPK